MHNLIRHKVVSLIVVAVLISSIFPYTNIANAETIYSFTGGGKSHGVGMSMAGVQKLAKAGRDYQTILKYYYKGISIQSKPSLAKIVRALVHSTKNTLSFNANNQVKIYDDKGAFIKTVPKDDIIGVKYGSGRYRLTISRNGSTYLNKLYARSIIIKRFKSSLIVLRNNNRKYEGDFLARSTGGKEINAINRVPLENYLRGLGEEPETWPIKGLRTLAVAARTYAVEKVLKHKAHYDINQTQQFYVGHRKAPRMAFAVNSTKSIVALYAGKPIIAAYSANNGGLQADFTTIWGGAGYPYLKAKKDIWSNGTKDYRWGPVKYSSSSLQAILRKNGVNVGSLSSISFSARGTDGRPSKVTIVGSSGSKTVWTYGQFAKWLGLKSSLIWVSKSTSSAGISKTASVNISNIVNKTSTATFVIDPGHGGVQSGAVGPNGIQEKSINLKVALKLRNYLQAAGAKVIMTRTTDKTLSLGARAAIVNKSKADRFVSIHHNSSVSRRVNGTETYIRRGSNSTSIDLGKKVHKSLVTNLGLSNRGVKRASFYVLRKTKMPAILTEASFISNRAQASRLKSNAYLDQEARAIFYGIKSHISLKVLNAPLSLQGGSSAASDINFAHVIDTDGYWRSFVSIKNIQPESRDIVLTFYNDSGVVVGSRNINIAANSTYSFYPRKVIGSNFSGSLRATTTDSSIVGSISQASKSNKALGAMQALTGATELYIPRIVDDSKWSSFVSIKNVTDTQNTVSINYYNFAGSLVKTETATLEAQAKYNFYPKINTGADFDGSIEISATANIVSMMSRINKDKNRFALAAATSKSANAYTGLVYDNTSLFSYLTIKNTSTEAQPVTIYTYSEDGTLISQNSVSINPKAIYENRLINFAGSAFKGSVKVSASTGVIVAYLTETNSKATSLAMTELQQPVSDVSFAYISDGSTWNSEVSVVNTDSALVDVSLEAFNASGTSLYSSTSSVNGFGYYSFNPFSLVQTTFNGSVEASASSIQLVGYLSQSK